MIAATHSTGFGIFQLLLFICIAIGVFIASIFQKRVRQQRMLDLQILAQRLGFDDFNPNRDETFVQGWGFLSRLSQGSNRYAFNILRGSYQGQALFIFDYHFETGSGKNRQDHVGTMLMLIVKEVFPQVLIGHENLLREMMMTFGIGDEIKFESVEFSKAFCVRCKDKKFSYDVCNAQMMEFLLANRDLQIEIQGPIISIAFEPQLPAEKIEFNLQRLAQIRSLLPDYLFNQNI
jgi:hypothetical protein